MANRWKPEEDAVLAKNVRENYDNLEIAFKKTSLEIERTVSACKQRWYGYFCVNPKAQKEYNVCFITLSNRRAMINRKTLPNNYSETYKDIISKKSNKLKSIMRRIIELFK